MRSEVAGGCFEISARSRSIFCGSGFCSSSTASTSAIERGGGVVCADAVTARSAVMNPSSIRPALDMRFPLIRRLDLLAPIVLSRSLQIALRGADRTGRIALDPHRAPSGLLGVEQQQSAVQRLARAGEQLCRF